MGVVERRAGSNARLEDAAAETLFAGAGEARALGRSVDWVATPLGPVCSWPAELRAVAGLAMAREEPAAVIAATGSLLLHNDACARWLRAEHARAFGRDARAAFAGVDARLVPLLARALAGETVSLRDVRRPSRRSPPGAPREGAWHDVHLSPVRDAAGAVVAAFCTGHDVTARVLAERRRDEVEATLRASEARDALVVRLGDALRSLTDAVEIQATSSRLLGEHLRVQRVAYADIEGRDAVIRGQYAHGVAPLPERFPFAPFGEGVVDAYHRGEVVAVDDVDDDPRFTAHERAVLHASEIAAFAGVMLRREGRGVAAFGMHSASTRRWTADELSLVTEVAERTWAAVERARAEAAVRESETRFRAVANLVPDLLWRSEPDGSTSWYNERWYTYTGQTPAAAAGWGWIDAIHPEDREASARRYAEAAAAGTTVVLEHRIRAADGRHRWFLVRAEPQRDADGRVTHWFGAATDIHAQRCALVEVERRVVERTAERDALRRQLASAEEAERRRLARELHDQLGQQLTAFALGLDDAARLAATREGVRADEGAPLLRRLTQLRELAREMTAGAHYLALELRPPELDDVGLESALETYVREWSRRYGIAAEMAVTGSAEHRAVPNDVGSALYRIVQEALTNVAKHAQAGQVSVILDQPDGEVRLIVEDDGRGFDVAASAERVRRERRLGLSSMRERAALVGGSLEIESSPGGGTTLYVRVPRAGA